METPTRKFARLVDVFDRLVNEESAIQRESEFEQLADLHRRLQPVVDGLVALGLDVAGDTDRDRLAAIHARRQVNLDLIESQLVTTRTELNAVQESGHRVAKIVPLYGKADAEFATTGRLSASG